MTFEIKYQTCHEGYCLSWIIMCMKRFVYRLSQDCYLDIDHNVLSAYCRSSSGDSVGFLSSTICTDYLHQTFMERVNLSSTNFLPPKGVGDREKGYKLSHGIPPS